MFRYQKHHYHECSDEALMTLISGGREGAFDELYRRYARRMLCFFYRKLDQGTDKAQDFLQELFLKIAEKPQAFDASRSFVVWIYTVACNMCKNEYRRNAVRGPGIPPGDLIEMADQTIASVSDKLDHDLFIGSLHRALAELDEKHQTTFILRYNDNLSIREISEVLACAEGTVKSRLFYTLQKLSVKLTVFDPHREEK